MHTAFALPWRTRAQAGGGSRSARLALQECYYAHLHYCRALQLSQGLQARAQAGPQPGSREPPVGVGGW